MEHVKHIDNIEKQPLKAGKGVTIQLLLSGNETEHFAMRCFTIEKEGFMPLHTNSVEHEQYVLSGRAEVVLGAKTFEAKAGDILYIKPGVKHSYKTLGEIPYKFLCLVPNKEDEITMCD